MNRQDAFCMSFAEDERAKRLERPHCDVSIGITSEAIELSSNSHARGASYSTLNTADGQSC
jgi:hypothetical protein